jgi:hypothetical protein
MCCVAHIHRQGARSNKETYFPPQKARRVSFQDARGCCSLFQCWRSNFHQTNLKPETLLQQQPASLTIAKVISSLQSNNQYDAGRTWKFSLIYLCEQGGRNNWRTNGSAHKKCIFPPAASGARRAQRGKESV